MFVPRTPSQAGGFDVGVPVVIKSEAVGDLRVDALDSEVHLG